MAQAQVRNSIDSAGDAGERLRTLADVCVRTESTWEAALDRFYKGVRGDAELLWEMIGRERMRLSQPHLSAAYADLRAERLAEKEKEVQAQRLDGTAQAAQREQARGHRRYDTQRCPAPRATLSERTQPVLVQGARPIPAAVPAATQKPHPAAWLTGAALDRVADQRARIIVRSMLDTFVINGQPIGDLKAPEALGWAKSRRRDAYFIELLCANLPHDKPIRAYRSAAETNAIYEQAKQVQDS